MIRGHVEGRGQVQRSKQGAEQMYGAMRTLQADDIGRIIVNVVTQPAHVAINEILVRPTDQAR